MESEPTPPYSKECIISTIAKKAYRDFAGGPLTAIPKQRAGVSSLVREGTTSYMPQL